MGWFFTSKPRERTVRDIEAQVRLIPDMSYSDIEKIDFEIQCLMRCGPQDDVRAASEQRIAELQSVRRRLAAYLRLIG